MKQMICCCGHDCARCLTYLATVHNDEALRRQSQEFYQSEFGIDIPPEDIHCHGGRSEDVFCLCRACPFVKCCRERGVDACSDCTEYPCGSIRAYQEKYVNKCNQIN